MRWWWIEHHTHHSSQHYNLTTALRQPWFGPLTGLVIIAAPLVLLGFNPAFIAFAAGINLVYQYWIHTEAIGRMPKWFEAVMNTPSHHRVHHATNPRYLDANFAGVFIIWDRMFGSFVPELDHDKPIYGTVTLLKTQQPRRRRLRTARRAAARLLEGRPASLALGRTLHQQARLVARRQPLALDRAEAGLPRRPSRTGRHPRPPAQAPENASD